MSGRVGRWGSPAGKETDIRWQNNRFPLKPNPSPPTNHRKKEKEKTSAGATTNSEPWLDLVYKGLPPCLRVDLLPFPLHFPLTVAKPFLHKSPSKCRAAIWAAERQKQEEGRHKCYCTCCGGNNLKMNNALWVPWGTDVFLTFPLSLPLPTCKGGVGWTWISIKEQAQQQQSLKELTSGWIKYVTEWGSVVNDGVGWDLIPICLFREYLVIITPHPPPQTALWSARAVQPGACKPCCVQPFTGTAHCRAENGPKVTTWFCTFPLKSFNYRPTAGWSPVLASLLTLLSKDFDIQIFFFQRIFSNFSGRKNITSSVKRTRLPLQTCCRRDFWDCS